MKRRFGLSLEKDGPYAILVVASTAILSGFCFGFTGFQQVLTAQWKVHFQLPIQVASLHQRFSQGFMYFGSILVTIFYAQISPAQWMILSSLLSVAGYGTLLLFMFLGSSWLTVLQIIMGILAGLGSGFSYGIICITPQFWLEKKRKKLNPYLFLGYPGFLLLSVTLGNYLCSIFSWYGAVIVIVGIFLNQMILGTIFIRHESEPVRLEKTKFKIGESIVEIKNVLAIKGCVPMLVVSAISSGFICSGVMTEVTNVAIESGIEPVLATKLLLFASLPELIFRPIWGYFCNKHDVTLMQLFYLLSFLLSQIALALSSSYSHFISGMLLYSIGICGYTGIKFVLFIELVGTDKLRNVLLCDQVINGSLTLIVPYVSSSMVEFFDTPKVIFFVNTFAAIFCISVGLYIRKIVHTNRRISRMTIRPGIEENQSISIIQDVRKSSILPNKN